MERKYWFLNFLLCFILLPSYCLAIEDMVAVKQKKWLIISDKEGLKLTDQANQVISYYPGSYKQVDAYIINDDANENLFIGALNSLTNGIDFFEVKNNQLIRLITISELNSALEGFCFYYNQSLATLDVFLLKDQEPVEQKTVYRSYLKSVVNQSVRTIPFVGKDSRCSVNSNGQVLYIAEENIGVWQFNANAETPLKKSLVWYSSEAQLEKYPIKKIEFVDSIGLVIFQENRNVLTLLQDKASKPISIFIPFEQPIDENFTARFSYNNRLTIHSYDEERLVFSKTVSKKQLANESTVNNLESNFFTVEPTAETTPVVNWGDAADDPAVWVNHKNPQKSLILGTNKKSGLSIYNLDGSEQQYIAAGRLNNVDIRQGLELGNKSYAVAVASERNQNAMAFFLIDEQTRQTTLINTVVTGLDDVYGICLYRQSQDEQLYAIINDKQGKFNIYHIAVYPTSVEARLAGQFSVIDQPEGCVADDRRGILYIGIEDHGIWSLDINAYLRENESLQQSFLEQQNQLQQDTKNQLNPNVIPQKLFAVNELVKADIEGLALYQTANHNWLIVSSQGNDSYAIFDVNETMKYLGSFKIVANLKQEIDGASETDGLETVSFSLGEKYPDGLLVVQDGRNVMPMERQNFKLVSFKVILNNLKKKY
ncbi:phytase [Aliikangiella maris]|uniref:Phytase n=2 Tax=Aliikangiella maris TaxID=3162458 RepID=A0ABV3MN87_9GAMM